MAINQSTGRLSHLIELVQPNGAIASANKRRRGAGHAVAVAHVNGDGKPFVSFRGSAQVFSEDQLAIWARQRDDGLAAALAERPDLGADVLRRAFHMTRRS